MMPIRLTSYYPWAVLATLCFVGVANAQSSVSPDVDRKSAVDVASQLIQAYANHDELAFDSLATSGYMRVWAGGGIAPRHVVLEIAKNGQTPVPITTVGEPLVSLHGNGGMVITTVKIDYPGMDREGYVRFVVAVAREGSSWKAVGSAMVKVPWWDLRKPRDEELVPLAMVACDQEPFLDAKHFDFPTYMRFRNESPEMITIHWLDYQGRRAFPTEVKPGDEFSTGTAVTHAWVITDRTGTCTGVVPAGSEPGIFVYS